MWVLEGDRLAGEPAVPREGFVLRPGRVEHPLWPGFPGQQPGVGVVVEQVLELLAGQGAVSKGHLSYTYLVGSVCRLYGFYSVCNIIFSRYILYRFLRG